MSRRVRTQSSCRGKLASRWHFEFVLASEVLQHIAETLARRQVQQKRRAEAEQNPVGDRVCERDHEEREEGRDGLDHVVPVNLRGLRHHQRS